MFLNSIICILPYLLSLVNAKDSFTNLDLPSKGLVASPMRQTLYSKKSLKKLPPMDEGSTYSPLGGRRGSFPETYHLNSDVGSQRPPTSGNLCLDPPKDRVLWCTQSQNRSPLDERGCHLQRRYIRQFCELSPQ
jgi:hypothetical protein